MGPLFGDRQQSARLYRFLSRSYDTLRPLFAGFSATRAAYYEYFDAGPDDLVLDLGCGTGASSAELGEQAKSVVGVDISPGQLRVARAKPTRDEMAFAVGDAMHLPFRTDAFDGVASVGSLQHVPDVGVALAEAHRVTRPGGQLFVVGPRYPGNPVSAAVADALMHFMRPAAMERRARAGGWTDVQTRTVPMRYLARRALVLTGTA